MRDWVYRPKGFIQNIRKIHTNMRKGMDILRNNFNPPIPQRSSLDFMKRPKIPTLQTIRNTLSGGAVKNSESKEKIHTKSFLKVSPNKKGFMFMKFSWFGKLQPHVNERKEDVTVPPLENKDEPHFLSSKSTNDENKFLENKKDITDEETRSKPTTSQQKNDDVTEYTTTTIAHTNDTPATIDDVTPSLCSLPEDRGPCRAISLRWFYNPRQQKCEIFVYGGCAGNANRFQTLPDCVSACAGI